MTEKTKKTFYTIRSIEGGILMCDEADNRFFSSLDEVMKFELVRRKLGKPKAEIVELDITVTKEIPVPHG